MPTYVYKAMNSVGQNVRDEVEAGSSEDAVAKVRQMGYFPTEVKEKPAGRGKGRAKADGRAPSAAGAIAGKRRTVGAVSKKLLTQFTRQLSTLIDAGLPILRSLRILENQQKPGMLRVAIRMVADDVEGGSTLSEAMARHPKAFDRLYSNMVRAGELGGVLDIILQRLAEFMERSQALKRKVIGAMIYPAAVISFAMGIVVILLIFVIPSFKEIFSDMGERLPGMTRMLLDASDWVKGIGWIVILAAPVVLFLLLKLIRTSNGGRYALDKVKLKVPIFGMITSKVSVARFTRTLGTLLSAGVPILEALNITRETTGNDVFARAISKVHDGIREGESFADPLRQAKVVEPMVVNMIDVGEETGELDKMLNKVADNYDDEVSTLIASMVSLLEPVMVITLGGIVGFIVIALFMPMVGMLNAVSR